MFEFKTVAKPVIKRVANPFLEVVATLNPKDETDARFFTMESGTKDKDKDIRVALRQLTEAGNEIENPVTVRRNIVEKPGVTEITFWAVPKIVHGDKTTAELEKEIEAEVKAEVKKAISKKG